MKMNMNGASVSLILLLMLWSIPRLDGAAPSSKAESSCNSTCASGKAVYCRSMRITSLRFVQVDKIETVERLYLSGNFIKLTGTKPEDSLGRFTNLKLINLGKNGITDIPPTFFENNLKLEEINLDSNILTKIPEKLFDKLANLEIVWLRKNKLSNIPNKLFKNTKNLSALVLSHNQLKRLDENLFTENENVQALIVKNISITDLTEKVFTKIPNLVTLDISDNKIENLTTNLFGNKSKLEALKIEGNKLPFFDPEFFKIIKRLQLLWTSGFADCCIAKRWIKNIKCSYKGNGKKECGVRLMPLLDSNFIGRVEINEGNGVWNTICDRNFTKQDADAVCREMGHNAAVEPLLPEYVEDGTESTWSRELDCSGDEYSTMKCTKKNETSKCEHSEDVGVRCQIEVERMCKACLCSNGRIDCSKKELRHMPWMEENDQNITNATSLDVSENKIEWMYVDILKPLLRLKKLVLSRNNLGKLPAEVFAYSGNMQELDLAGNQLSNIPETLLQKMPNLIKINLAKNGIKEIPANLFNSSRQLTEIDLSENKLSGFKPDVFTSLQLLKKFTCIECQHEEKQVK